MGRGNSSEGGAGTVRNTRVQREGLSHYLPNAISSPFYGVVVCQASCN